MPSPFETISRSRFETLVALEVRSNYAARIARKLYRYPNAVCVDIRELEERGFVIREKDEDLNITIVHITENGKKFIQMTIAFNPFFAKTAEFIRDIFEKPDDQ